MPNKCDFFDRRGTKTMPLMEWRGIHDQHMDSTGRWYATAPLANAPEGYGAQWLICYCGARILTKADEGE